MRKIIAATLALLTLSTAAHAELYTPTEYPYAATVIATLKVRGGPGSEHAQIDEVRRGDRLVILRCERAFCLSDRENGRVRGWVHSDYFVPTGPVEQPPATIEIRPTLTDRMILSPSSNIKLGF